ncbi:hypothetical protein [Paenibacillus sp.]|jgi:hypothetical protein|uniref:hypothetical protein n=1 Tax=Paenibacillus sp. TaxID=58172 RepID=UPI0028247695|nr:hypothetical protein [Paenibacillus sp.]MDR0269242.1 hypothetical protein [Paenibacillus sp.]
MLIPDPKINPDDTITYVSNGYVFEDYDAYVAKAAQMNAPFLKISETYPKDYKFKRGNISLKTPDESLHQELGKKLRAEAVKGDKEVYTMPVEAGEADTAVLMFEKGSVKMELVAHHIKEGTTPVPAYIDNPEKVETMVIGGIECTYLHNGFENLKSFVLDR